MRGPSHRAGLHGVRALIGDDNPINRFVLAEKLTAWGARVESFTGAADALAGLATAANDADPYRIAIIDCRMPDTDGVELALAIRAGGRIDPVVVNAASDLAKILTDVLQDGDLLLLMGAGDIGSAAQQLADHGFEGSAQ